MENQSAINTNQLEQANNLKIAPFILNYAETFQELAQTTYKVDILAHNID